MVDNKGINVIKNFFNNKLKENDLAKSLSEMSKASDKAYDVAIQFLDKLTISVREAKNELNKFETVFKSKHYQDLDLNAKLNSTFLNIRNSFDSIVRNCNQDLENKKRNDANFNITLFGKTKAGKSTLMSILTHGNDEKIGKGSQRTTLDVRSYKWNEMVITDVPGIEAYGGEEDDEKAYEATKNADLILFLITAGQPESAEANWLVKLKQEDKPLLCICNCKKSLEGPRKDIFLKNPDKFLKEFDFEGIKAQFNEFVKKELPNEFIDILVVHLQAKYLSAKETDNEKQQKLSDFSNFQEFENRIIDDVRKNAKFYRQKSYLALIDSSLYIITKGLFDSSEQVCGSCVLIEEKQKHFNKWKAGFQNSRIQDLENKINDIFQPLYDKIPKFASENVDNKNVNENWGNVVKNYNLDSRVKQEIELSIKRCHNRILEFFSELDKEMSLSNIISSDISIDIDSKKDFNWKKMWGWAGAVVGGGLAIVEGLAYLGAFANPITAPIALAAGVVTGILALVSWLADNEDQKRKKAEEKIRKQLRSNLDDLKQKVCNKAKEVLIINTDKIISESNQRFNDILGLTKTLYLSHHKLALDLDKEHVAITKKIFKYVSDSYQEKRISTLDDFSLQRIGDKIMYYFDSFTKDSKIINVARIPAKRILIAVKEPIVLPDDFNKSLGTNDVVEQVVVNQSQNEDAQIRDLIFKYMGVDPSYIDLLERKVLIENKLYTDTQDDYKYLIQQLYNIQIVKL